jgi:hypothetical protein
MNDSSLEPLGLTFLNTGVAALHSGPLPIHDAEMDGNAEQLIRVHLEETTDVGISTGNSLR